MKKLLSLLLISVATSSAFAYNSSNWFRVGDNNTNTEFIGKQYLYPNKYSLYQLNLPQIKATLSAVSESQSQAIVLALPTPDGGLRNFKVWQTPVMEKGLADKYPQIKNYTAIALDNSAVTAKINLTSFGFDAAVFDGNKTYLIDPFSKQNTEYYLCYYKRDFPIHGSDTYGCNVVSSHLSSSASELLGTKERAGNNDLPPVQYKTHGNTRKTYRLALACTGEYSIAVTTGTPTKVDVLSAMNTSIARVNGIFEREINVSLIIINNNDLIIYLDGTADPYSNNSGSTMQGENQANVDNVIGKPNYDLGHVFSTGGGGIADLASVCGFSKARGVTGQPMPFGAYFDIDFVVHEMGHQFGATHTFNTNCGGNQVSISAYEPGSASSIMGYAGICGIGNDLQGHSDDYFHAKSLDQINIFLNDITKGALCATSNTSGNTPPVVASIQQTYNIPYLTPFELEAPAAQDNDHDVLTYCWEQYDLGDFGKTFAQTRVDGPIFRSFEPTTSRWRVFPVIDSIIRNNTNYLGEKLPDTGRELNFKLTVRDMYNGHGTFNLSDDELTLNVTKTSGPFIVTSPNNANDYWQIGSSVNVQWDVANTTAAPVSCANVDIYLSLDGGHTYPITLATNTPNDGSEMITVPSGSNTLSARVKVKGAGNVFFDISNNNFKINTWPLNTHNIAIDDEVKVYPVPTDNMLYLSTSGVSQYNVQVLNTIGQTVWKGDLESQISVSVTTWSPGVYYIQFINKDTNKAVVKKVLVN